MNSIKLFHAGNPFWREDILKNSLVPKMGDSYMCHYEENMGPVVFVAKDNDYDSTYDDDRYLISLTKEEFESLEFEVDKEVYNGLFTKHTIKPKYLSLIHIGTGESTF